MAKYPPPPTIIESISLPFLLIFETGYSAARSAQGSITLIEDHESQVVQTWVTKLTLMHRIPPLDHDQGYFTAHHKTHRLNVIALM